MDANSVACLKSELDLFSTTPVQLAIDDSSFVEIHPLASLSQNSPIEFYISGSGEKYLDLSHTVLHIQAKVLKKNSTNIVDTDIVAPINYVLNTMFSECSIYLNDKQVSSQVNYAYRSIIESLLFTSYATQNTLLTSSFFYKDTPSKHNDFTTANIGFTKRKELSKESNVIDLAGALHFDLAYQPKLIPSGISVRIKLEKNKNAFVLMSANDHFKLEIVSACLYVRKVSVNSSVMIAHEKALSKGVIKIPIRRVEVKTFALSKGIQSHTVSNAFLSELPTKIILTFVLNESYNGKISTNPFEFKHFDVNYLCLINNGKMVPSKPFQPNFEGNMYARCFLSMFTNLGRFHRSPNIPISYETYSQGENFFCFDLTADFSANECHASINKSGNIAIDLKFAKPLTETVSLIVYAEYRNKIEIDMARNVYCDY